MVVVEMKGGLGNQLFQYGLSRELAYLGRKVLIDNSMYASSREKRKFMLTRFPKIHFQVVDPFVAERMRGYSYDRSLIKRIYYHFSKKNTIYPETKSLVFDDKVLQVDDCYISGYWQSYKYFDNISQQLRDELEFPKEVQNVVDNYSNRIKEMILNNNSVSIHLRLTDYIGQEYNELGSICDRSYYRAALQMIKERISHPVYFIFSDDISSAKGICEGLFEQNKHVFVENRMKDDLMDLYFMSLCKGHVLANSTFSFWAGWLSGKESLVIAPKTWMVGAIQCDIQCPGWLLL